MFKIDIESMDSGTLNLLFGFGLFQFIFSYLCFIKEVLVIAIIKFVYMENQFINPK